MTASTEDGSSVNVTYPLSVYDSLVSTYQSFSDGTDGDVTTYQTSNPNSQTWLISTDAESYSISVTESDPDANVFLVVGSN